MMENEKEEEKRFDLESAFGDMFSKSISATGEEELLRIASDHAKQYTSEQMMGIVLLEWIKEKAKNTQTKREIEVVIQTIDKLKRYHHSDEFVMRALDSGIVTGKQIGRAHV